MNDAASQSNASVDMPSARPLPSEGSYTPLEDSFADYSAPPEVSPIHALRRPMLPATHEADNAGDEDDAASDAALSNHETDEGASLQQPTSTARRENSELASLPSVNLSTLNFSKQYQRARQQVPVGRQGESEQDLSTYSREAARAGSGGFLQLGLRKYRADVEEIDRYAQWCEAVDRQQKQRVQALVAEAREHNEREEEERAACVGAKGADAETSATRHPEKDSVFARLSRQTGTASSASKDLSEQASPLPSRDATTLEVSNAASSSPPPHATQDQAASREPRQKKPHATGSTKAIPRAHARQEDTDAFARLYAEAQERERRLTHHRERVSHEREQAQRESCSFQPSRSPWKASSPSSTPRLHQGSREGGREEDEASSQPRRARRSRSGSNKAKTPRGPSVSYADFDEFLCVQREREEQRQEKLRAAARQAQLDESPGLLQSVPPSAVRKKMEAYLVKEKGYVDPVTGWQARFQAYMDKKKSREGRHARTGTPRSSVSVATNSVRRDRTASQPQSARGTRRSASTSHAEARSGPEPRKTGGSIFERLHHESSSRATARRLLTLMQMEHEARQYFQPNRGMSFSAALSSAHASEDCQGAASRAAPTMQDKVNDDDDGEAVDVDSALASSTSAASGQHPRQSQQRRDGEEASGDASFVPPPNVFTGPVREGVKGSEERRGGGYASANTRTSVFDELYDEKDEIRRRRELARMAVEEQDEVYTFHPDINPRSRELLWEKAQAIARGERPAHAHTSRDHKRQQQRAGESHRTASSSSAAAAKTARSKRVGTPRSSAERDGVIDADAFHHRVAVFAQQHDAKMQAARLASREAELQACSFRPTLSPVSRAITTPRPGAITADVSQPRTGSASAGLVPPSPASPQPSGGHYVHMMETPQVRRALWASQGARKSTHPSDPREPGQQKLQQPPPNTRPDTAAGAARNGHSSAAASPLTRQQQQRQTRVTGGGSAASTPTRRRAEDPTPAGPEPLNKLLPSRAPRDDGDGTHAPNRVSRVMSIDVGNASTCGGGAASKEANGESRRSYFLPGAAYCEEEEEEEEEERERAARHVVQTDEVVEPLTDDQSSQRRAQPTPRPAAASAAPSCSSTARAAAVAAVAPLSSLPTAFADGQRSLPPPLSTTDRPPLSPQKGIEYGLAGVRGAKSATSSELVALEQELRGVMAEWTERLQHL